METTRTPTLSSASLRRTTLPTGATTTTAERVTTVAPNHNNNNNTWFWVGVTLLVLALGALITALVYHHYKYACKTNADCKHLCDDNPLGNRCQTKCENGLCESYAVVCDLNNNETWCPTLRQCIDTKTTACPSTQAQSMGDAEYMMHNGEGRYHEKKSLRYLVNMLKQDYKSGKLSKANYQKHMKYLRDIKNTMKSTGMSFSQALMQYTHHLLQSGQLSQQEYQKHMQYYQMAKQMASQMNNNNDYEAEYDMDDPMYQQYMMQMQDQGGIQHDMNHKYMKYMKDAAMAENNEKKKYNKYIQCMGRILMNCRWSKPKQDGMSHGKGKDGAQYTVSPNGDMYKKDSQGNHWIKGAGDNWWLRDKNNDVLKKNSQGTMWKKDHAGNVWKKVKRDSKWHKLGKSTKKSTMDMSNDVALGKHFYQMMQMPAAGADMDASMGRSVQMAEAGAAEEFGHPVDMAPLGVSPQNNYGFDYDPTCGYASRVNLYGQTYALDEPFDVNNGMVPTSILPTKRQRGVAANISEYGTDPELLGYGTTHKDYYPVD